jgi:hypothetical protein
MFYFTYYVKICIESSSHNVHINTFLHALKTCSTDISRTNFKSSKDLPSLSVQFLQYCSVDFINYYTMNVHHMYIVDAH